MALVVPILSLVVLLFTLLVFIYVVAYVRSVYISLLEQAKSYFIPESENKPSAFAETVNMAGQVIGLQVGQAVSQVLNGSLGGSIKQTNAELEQRALIENPEIAQKLAFQELLPKSTKKNSLANFMMQKIFDMAMKTGPGNGTSTSTSVGSPKFKL